MARYFVMEPPAATDEEAVETARLIRDGFSVPAFAISPLWLLWHRLWIEAALFFAASMAIVAAADAAGLGPAGSALSLLLSFYVGLEGPSLYASALRRRGWQDWCIVEAGSIADAEARYAARVVEDVDHGISPASEGIASPKPGPTGPSRVMAGPALGLLGYPGRS